MKKKSIAIRQFDEIVSLIRQTRDNLFRTANLALIDLYWNVGERISHKIANSEWGEGVVRQLTEYISYNYPDLKGFSDKNLWRMKQFYETYADEQEKLSPLVREISWTNNAILLSRTKSIEEKEFYLQFQNKLQMSEKFYLVDNNNKNR